MSIKIRFIFGALCVILLSSGLQAADDDYVNIRTDLASGMELQEVADRAYDNADDYWANNPENRDGDEAFEQRETLFVHGSTRELPPSRTSIRRSR